LLCPCVITNKNLPSQMGREALTRPVVPPKLTVLQHRTIHFVPTNIDLPFNAGIAAQTICVVAIYCGLRSLARLKRELQLGSDECSFQHSGCISLAASASLLSSVTAFYLITVIISETICLSRPSLFNKQIMVAQRLPSTPHQAPGAQ
jgi:hypothetical protein